MSESKVIFEGYEFTVKGGSVSYKRVYEDYEPLGFAVPLTDGKAYQFEVKHKVNTSTLHGVYDSDRDTMNIHQGFYFDRAGVINIKPLTLGDKSEKI